MKTAQPDEHFKFFGSSAWRFLNEQRLAALQNLRSNREMGRRRRSDEDTLYALVVQNRGE